MEDKVNHPSHYTWLKEKCGVEVIDIIRHLDFPTGSAVKYLLRAGRKEEYGMDAQSKYIEDLKKARWYIDDLIRNASKQMPYVPIEEDLEREYNHKDCEK
ncbi:MAG: DUF3310 domain-containing protein [Bacteroidaceae bacterium]|nr:DUF3310 domain-containing protein [Bacteroidaceae bacterium]